MFLRSLICVKCIVKVRPVHRHVRACGRRQHIWKHILDIENLATGRISGQSCKQMESYKVGLFVWLLCVIALTPYNYSESLPEFVVLKTKQKALYSE